jgi:hypothetical protein
MSSLTFRVDCDHVCGLLTRRHDRWPMCGRPAKVKGGSAKFSGGSKAVMCPASSCGHMTRAQIGSANDILTDGRYRCTTGQPGFSRSSVRPITIFCYVLEPLKPACGSGGSRRLTPICLTARHHALAWPSSQSHAIARNLGQSRPDYPGHLVGQSHRREFARLALQQL